MSTYILPLLILIPVLGAGLITIIPTKCNRCIGRFALTISTLTFGMTLLMLAIFLKGGIDGEYKLLFECDFLPQLGSSIHFGIDGISLWLVMLTGLLSPLSIWSSFTSIRQGHRSYYALLLLLQAGMTGVFISMDLLMFYMFFEFTLVPLFLVVGIWGGPQRRPAAFKLFIYTMAGGVLTFAGIIYIAWLHYSNTGTLTFDIATLYGTSIPESAQLMLFLAFFAGFAVKVPLFPFHTWLPLAHTEAPTAGSVILAGVLLKLGTYGFMRILLPMLPEISYQLAPTVAVLSIIGIIYGSVCAWVQTDIKKLVAYSSVAHLGFCMLGMFAFNHEGLSGSLLYMINHGISTGALFLVIGMVYERYHTREFSKLGGLAVKMPIMAVFMILFSLSSIGLPGLNGFVSEFSILYAVFTSGSEAAFAGPLGKPYAIIAASGVILSAIYMLYMCQRLLFGPLNEPPVHDDLPEADKLPVDLNCRESMILMPLAILVVVLGVYPKIFFASTSPAIQKIQDKICVVQDEKPKDTASTANGMKWMP
ncbi:MAG: NADH-quinone oxidoreductase subunit M [Phycisphaerae bacterium]|nr:NADH-quinone oxidoreductase subunit M [Phycisphaerae bacterium]